MIRQFIFSFVALGLILSLMPVFTYFDRTYWRPTSHWFEVHRVSVPNFREGENPTVVYSTSIHRVFRATWTAHILRVDGDPTRDDEVCLGTGTNTYRPNRKATPITLKWYMGRECKIPPGQYQIVTEYDFLEPAERHLTTLSNVFTVSGK